MAQSTLLILYDNQSDGGVLAGGSWSTELPLDNLVIRNIRKVARTTDLDPTSTQFTVSLVDVLAAKAIVVGPTNLTVNYSYKITWYSDEFVSEIDNTGWVNPFEATLTDPFDIAWEASYFWLGTAPYDDQDRGIWLIHVFDSDTSANYWKIEIKDELNPDGYVQAGRLFMAQRWSPSLNYIPESNGLGFLDGTLASGTLRGGKHFWRRINPRVWTCKINLPDSEAFGSGYEFLQKAGYDGEVFIIPDPSDATNLQKRSFLATISESDLISQAVAGRSSIGFKVEEIVQ